MDALKKFLNKKKSDKVFKKAGQGQRLGESSGAGAAVQQPQQRRTSAGAGGTTSPQKGTKPSGPTEEKKAAAAAALARLEKGKKPGDVDPDKLRATRQMAFIKEQARKELDAEKAKAKEAEAKGGKSVGTKEDEEFDIDKVREKGGLKRGPEEMAVTGVFFTCPLVGPEVLTRPEIEENIKSFLLEQPEEEGGVTACLLIHSCNKPMEKVSNCVETLCKYLDNIISCPTEPKFQRIRCSNRVYQEKVSGVVGAQQFLKAAGFDKRMMKADPSSSDPEEEFWMFTGQDESTFVPLLTELRDMLRQTTPILPELDRNVQVLMPVQVTTRRDLPDEFYALSLDEIKKEQQLKSEVAQLETTLRTKAMRERDEKREQRLYRYALLRIRFPDGFTLQGTFKAFEKLSHVYEFIRENLVEDLSFDLVRSGGESLTLDTSGDCTLAELKLAPSSILNFKAHSAPAPLATGEVSFLKPEVLELVRSLAE